MDTITKFYNIDLSQPSPIYIEGDRMSLPLLFKELGFKIGAEIGVLEGDFSSYICKTLPDAKIYSIDPWSFYPTHKNFRKQRDHDRAYERAQRILHVYPNNTIIKKWSVDAAKDFEDESLDFVFIDGDHEFQAITNDIAVWLKKIRKGGIISGHDYGRSHDGQFGNVKDVVLAWTFSKKVVPWFVLETAPYMNNRDSGDYRETSWFWLKS
jgi:hypothetical protein